LGAAAVDGGVGLQPMVLYLSGLFWTLGYDTIYALQDTEDDALVGVKSSARALGENVRPGVAAFYTVCALLALLAAWWGGLGFPFYVVWVFFAAHLGWQALRLRRSDHHQALYLFRSNRDAGLLLAIALALGALHRG